VVENKKASHSIEREAFFCMRRISKDAPLNCTFNCT